MLTDLVDSFDNSKIPTIENILRTLNKLCYYSLPLCIEAFKAKMINPLAKLINILESQIGKGKQSPEYIKPIETQFAVLAYEVISLINAVLALRATPNPLMYLLFFWCKSDRSKVATYIGIKIMDNAYVEQRVEYFKVKGV